MKIKKLTKETAHEIMGKKLCCVEKSVPYLTDLCKKHDVINQIDIVIDSNIRSQGNFQLFGKDLTVYGWQRLYDMDYHGRAIVITSDYYNELYERLCDTLPVSDHLDVVYYVANQETEYDEFYRDRFKGCELKDIIIFRSGPHASSYIQGTDFSDNARALFEYMLAQGYNQRYELIWLVKDPDEYARYMKYENVRFLSFDWSVSVQKAQRDEYYKAICLAKYIFFTDAYGFARNSRPDQIRVQLWHGCGFKTRVNFVRCEHRYEYTTVISDLYANIHEEIYGLREDQVLVTGYAKQDWLFQPLVKDYIGLLQIPKADKYIFWLPTFRMAEGSLKALNEYELDSETGLPIANTFQKLGRLDDLLKSLHMVLIVKLHPFQSIGSVSIRKLSHIVLLDNMKLAEQDIQINQLLCQSDALISDYSSVAVDYMLLDKPMAFSLEDMGQYADSRGFVFENIKDWLPGKELFSFDDLCGFCTEVSQGTDADREKRRSLTRKMHKFSDGNSCRRILEALKIDF